MLSKCEVNKTRLSSVGILYCKPDNLSLNPLGLLISENSQTKKRPRRVSNSDSHSNVCGYSVTIQNPTPEGVEVTSNLNYFLTIFSLANFRSNSFSP